MRQPEDDKPADGAAPAPDPGNAPPEDWTTDLSDEELRAITDKLHENDGAA